MEGRLQVKDSTSASAEPIKSEGVVQNSDSSERSEGAASPPPNCSICLGKLINTSFTDSCLHQFCFTCLLQWSKIKTECPLCKQTFKSIIHNVRSEEDYDQYHVPRELASQLSQSPVMAIQHLDVNFEVDGNWDVGLRRFFYRTTMTDNRRRGILSNPEQPAREQLPPVQQQQVSREDHRYRHVNPTDFRRAIYTHGIWTTSLPDVFGRFRECSAEYYRRHPRELDRLVSWLNRELQILINNRPAHIPYVLRTIMEALTRHDIRSPQFRNIVRPYFGIHTEHFIHELLNFARTNFDVVGYDQAVTYLYQGLSREYVPHVVSPGSSSSSISSDDSDVRVLDEAIDLRVNASLPGVGPHPINMPGPSTVGQAFQLEIPYNVPDVLTISSGSSDDECEVICYVKPRHERTPEIIELDSSDPEDTNMPYTSNDGALCVRTSLYEDVPQASTSFNTKKGSWNKVYNDIFRTNLSETSSSSNNDSSDSDYNPRRSRQCRSHVKKSSKKKINNKRRKSSNVNTRKRADRSASSSGESDYRNKSSRRSSQRGKTKLCSSSESSLEEDKKKKLNEVKSRKETNSNRGTVHVRKDLIKKDDRYNQEDTVLNNDNGINTNSRNDSGGSSSSSSGSTCNSSSSSSTSNSSSSSSSSTSNSSSSSSSTSGSETYNESKDHKREGQQRSRTKCSTTSRVYDADKTERASRNKDKSRSMTNTISLDDSNRKCYRYKESKRSRTRSSSESSIQQKGKRSSCRKRQIRKRRNEYESKKGNNPTDVVLSKREGSTRSSSRSSNYSDRSYKHRRRSKHRDSCKDKKRKRSHSRSRSRSRSGRPSISRSRSRSRSTSRSSNLSATDSVMSTSSISKHSDSKNSSCSKEKHRLRKSHKKSKHQRSRSKSKSKKKKRRVRLSYNSSSTDYPLLNFSTHN